jgi:hypothetical protein
LIRYFLALAAFLLACDSNESKPEDLSGNWIYMNAVNGKGIGFDLQGGYASSRSRSYSYTLTSITMMTDDFAYVSLENGWASQTDDRLYLHPTQSTCGGILPVEETEYQVQLDSDPELIMSGINDQFRMSKTDQKAIDNLAVRFGCFKGNQFVHRAVQDL